MLGAVPAAPSNNSKALIHALECMQNRIKQMEQERAGLEQEFAEYRTRAAGQLSELQLAHADAHECAKDHAEQNRASEQSTAEAWERTGVLNAALMRTNGQVETLQVQLGCRDNELDQIRGQLARAGDAVSVAGSRASEYSARVTEMVGEVSSLRSELQRARADAESSRERAEMAEGAMRELRQAKEAAQAAQASEHVRASRAISTLRSVLLLSEQAAAKIPRAKIADLDSPASFEEAGPRMRIPGMPGYYLDIRACLEPKFSSSSKRRSAGRTSVPKSHPPNGAIRHAARKQARGTSVWVPPGPAFADGHALSSVHASTRRVKNPRGRSGTAPRLCKSGVPSKPRPDKGTQGKKSVKDKSATAWHDHTHHDDLGAEVDSFLERVIFEACTGTDPHQIGLDMLYSQITELNRCGSAACNRSSVHKCRVTSECAVCLVRWCEYACAGRRRRWTKEITQIVRWARSNFSRVFNEQ
eukprot:COSAG01_NODE_1150_length_11497_cov_35.040256_3_plen_473_part_00